MCVQYWIACLYCGADVDRHFRALIIDECRFPLEVILLGSLSPYSQALKFVVANHVQEIDFALVLFQFLEQKEILSQAALWNNELGAEKLRFQTQEKVPAIQGHDHHAPCVRSVEVCSSMLLQVLPEPQKERTPGCALSILLLSNAPGFFKEWTSWNDGDARDWRLDLPEEANCGLSCTTMKETI